jgi:hypothetical protein
MAPGYGLDVIASPLPTHRNERDETPTERLDRNTIELLNELATVLLMAPSIHHRLLFRHGEKSYLLRVANRLAVLAMIFLAAGFVRILILLSDVVVGGAGPLIAGILAAAGIGGLWFVLPLARRSEEPGESHTRELERG